jgi:hypothetical protein
MRGGINRSKVGRPVYGLNGTRMHVPHADEDRLAEAAAVWPPVEWLPAPISPRGDAGRAAITIRLRAVTAPS